ncbi:MAG: hypothetical protein K2G69_04410 [Muribaculaceae bacterium]|nr:hypothetical protein [Muribaculaceae bacterium]
MSTASASLTVTCLPNGKSYNVAIVCSKGDLYQYYDSGRVTPDFTAGVSEQPIVTLVFSATAMTSPIPPMIKLYWDDKEITFGSLNTGATNNAVTVGTNPDPILEAGTIKIEQKGDPANNLDWKLRFVKNIAKPSATTLYGHTLKVQGIFPAGIAENVKAFELTPLTESGEEVHIESGSTDATPFVVDQNKANSKCTLVAQVYRAGKAVTTTAGYTFQWYKRDITKTTGWETLAGKTGQSLEVTASDVETYTEYKVEVTHGGATFADTQSVMDVGDPFYITFGIKDQNNTDATASMNGNLAANEARIFTAHINSRTAGQLPDTRINSCCWLITTVDGVVQNNFAGNTNPTYGVASKNYNTNVLTLPAAWILSLNGGAGVQTLNIFVTIDI